LPGRSDWKRLFTFFPLQILRRHDEIDDHRLCRRFGVENCAFHRVKLSLAHLPHDGPTKRRALIEPLFSRTFRWREKWKKKKIKNTSRNYDYRSVENVSIGTRLMCVVARCHSEQEKSSSRFVWIFFWPFLYNQSPPPPHSCAQTKHLRILFFFSDSFIYPFYPSCQFERFRHGRRDCPADRTAERTGQTRRRFSS
jgi:hypothetical protein